MSSGGGEPSSQTTTNVTQLPAFEQQAAQNNIQTAQAIASQPYPTYSGQLIAGFTPQQTQGMQQAQAASTAYQPDLSMAEGMTAQSGQQWNPTTAAQYMSPYAQAALQPQIQALQIQQGQNQQGINAQATQAGAFGDSRQGVESALNNYFGGQNLNNLEATGMNTAYNTGLSAFQQGQQQMLGAGTELGNLGAAQQTLGEAGASANFNAGTQQQALNQSQLTEAYNNFMNQVNWPTQGLNLNIAALSDNPYTMANYTSLAPGSSTAQNVGAFSSLSGALGSLLGGGSSSSGGTNNSAIANFSDRRLKKDIKRIGKTTLGIPVYAFKYLWDEIERVGVMADEVEKVLPHAVITDKFGFKSVYYDMVA